MLPCVANVVNLRTMRDATICGVTIGVQSTGASNENRGGKLTVDVTAAGMLKMICMTGLRFRSMNTVAKRLAMKLEAVYEYRVADERCDSMH
jgi:hypothetical protein